MEQTATAKNTTRQKKLRKTRARSSSRGKLSGSGRFGIRYLHHHMFQEETPTDKGCPYVDCKCGGAMAAVYSGKTLIALTCSILVLLIGVTFMLVGYLIPRRSVVYLEKSNGSRRPTDDSALTFNNMLDDFTLIGTVLISLGALLFCLVLLVPICKVSDHKGEYREVPSEDVGSGNTRLVSVKKHSKDSTAVQGGESVLGSGSATNIDKIPVLALVHNIQPQPHEQQKSAASRNREYRKKRAEKYKDSFEEESEN
ncbi:predicted protein [Nematostella vectensis]|uniref:Transmembrane protein 74B n=1 Tax=Nematostella vectensis TaxID=45351 RepID=A7SM97_NEMVE|nr:uncharacterized protein LOC5506595 [Nematostella vectensis]EDO35178.1 predicted protein [Nematostella vectensis]|eukprot:XP_001627278.1 predicted protein [Nematostella vectensis]